MTGQVVILTNDYRKAQAKRLIDFAPPNAVMEIREAKRTLDQNALLWSLIGEIARAKPQGRVLSPDAWKALFMSAAGFQCTFEPSLDGNGVVPMGFKSSRLNKAEFSDLIEAIYAYAAEHGIVLSDEPATGIEARRAETGTGSVHESPARRGRQEQPRSTAA
jgi:hypothetical protein